MNIATGTQFFITHQYLSTQNIIFFFVEHIISVAKNRSIPMRERRKKSVKGKDIIRALKRHFRIKDDDITNEYKKKLGHKWLWWLKKETRSKEIIED